MKKMGLHELISLTFDSDPKVRKQAAIELAKYDAPAAMFALVELTYDKDKGVQETSTNLLEKMKEKNDQPELMSFAEVFSKGETGEKKAAPKPELAKSEEESAETGKEKMLRPIERMFEKKLGKEKGEMMKKRMMPTIEKMYSKAMTDEGGEKKISEEGKKAVHDMLSGYLDMVAGSEEVLEVAPNTENVDGPKQQSLADELELVGTKELKPEAVFKEVAQGALEDEASTEVEMSAEEKWMSEKPAEAESGGTTVFRLAFDTMMASKGDEKVMKNAMKKMLKNTEDQIKLAFDVAKNRYKELNITDITAIQSGMRNINTGTLYVKSIESEEYQRTKTKKDMCTRVVVADPEGNEGVIYLFDERGGPIKPGMKLKVEKGFAKTIDWRGETAITVSKKGKIYIIL